MAVTCLRASAWFASIADWKVWMDLPGDTGRKGKWLEKQFHTDNSNFSLLSHGAGGTYGEGADLPWSVETAKTGWCSPICAAR